MCTEINLSTRAIHTRQFSENYCTYIIYFFTHSHARTHLCCACVLVLSAQRVIWNSKYSIKLGGNQCQNPPRGFIAFSFPYPRPPSTYTSAASLTNGGRAGSAQTFHSDLCTKLYSGRPLYIHAHTLYVAAR